LVQYVAVVFFKDVYHLKKVESFEVDEGMVEDERR